MARLDRTLANLAPGVSSCRDLAGRYNARRGLAIYCLPIPGYSPASPGVVLGEALAARSGLGCTLLDGVPLKVPEGAVVVGLYNALKAARPDLMEDMPEMREHGQYAIKLGRHALIAAHSPEGLASGMQTLAMLILRHNEDQIPGSVIVDAPLCRTRCLAIELREGEININLLMQIVSFAATFKANRLHFILDRDFDPTLEIPGIDTFIQACQSFGIVVGVRLPYLWPMLTGGRTILETWSMMRSAARVFGAAQAALDDPAPGGVEPDVCRRIVQSAAKGEVGVQFFSLDARVVKFSGIPEAELNAAGITGWRRLWERDDATSAEDDFPVALDVQAPIPGFSARTIAGFHHRLNAALERLRPGRRREIMISFRDIGVSHLWQNLLYPAATGLIAAWGSPKTAEEASARFANLLYGDAGQQIAAMWETLAKAFPQGLSAGDEQLVRRTAFGTWPETDAAASVLQGIDWMAVTRNIKTGAEALKSAAAGLSRNASTLAGARLSLYALSWLHCFVALTPELERRRRLKYDQDARTEPIAVELFNNFQAWSAHLRELVAESGLELSEMPQVESMGLRLKGLCEGIFE